jgi:glycosyltransferase involved in cell wall biosynthesis
MRDTPIGVAVVGPYRANDGYPNVKWLLYTMARDSRIRLVLTRREGGGDHFFGPGKRSPYRVLFTVLRMIAETLTSLARLWLDPAARSCQVLYVPYPAVLPLLVLAWLPRGQRLVVADAFISLYDTLVNDRRLLARRGFAARLLYRVERRALSCADRVVTDTECNRRFLIRLFRFQPARVAVLALATDELNYRPLPYPPMTPQSVRVVFIATFVPLHGAETVAAAALRLAGRADIEFHWFGDGQCAAAVADLLARAPHRVIWRRRWSEPAQLAMAIADADICLGVFGETAKAGRVLPLKVYMALRVGRAVISATNRCWPGLNAAQPPPWLAVPPGNPDALASAIATLADNPSARSTLAQAGQRYYDRHLSNAKGVEQLYSLMLGG